MATLEVSGLVAAAHEGSYGVVAYTQATTLFHGPGASIVRLDTCDLVSGNSRSPSGTLGEGPGPGDWALTSTEHGAGDESRWQRGRSCLAPCLLPILGVLDSTPKGPSEKRAGSLWRWSR